MFVALIADGLLVPYLGLGPDSYEWLDSLSETSLAAFRRRALLESMQRLELPRRCYELSLADQLAAVVRASLQTMRGEPLIARIPCGLGEDCGSGGAVSRNPDTGDGPAVWTYRTGADIGWAPDLSGRRDMNVHNSPEGKWTADLRRELEAAEDRHGCVVRANFVIERGHLTMCRVARAATNDLARVASGIELVRSGRTTLASATASLRSDLQLDYPWLPVGKPPDDSLLLARGAGTSPGTASGPAVFTAGEPLRAAREGAPPVLIIRESHPSDLSALLSVAALVMTSGGPTSHASVVARSMAIPCITGIGGATLDPELGLLTLTDGRVVGAGDQVTVDGTTGCLYRGTAPATRRTRYHAGDAEQTAFVPENPTGLRPGLYVNADDADSIEKAIRSGAIGVGLCRMENIILRCQPENIANVPNPIGPWGIDGLTRLLADEISKILKACDGRPVNIRLLDAGHDALPLPFIASEARRNRQRPDAFRASIDTSMGVRGIRRNLLHPSLVNVQTRAILMAIRRTMRASVKVNACVLVPMVTCLRELLATKALVAQSRRRIGATEELIPLRIGAMIETPRAALISDQLAANADLVSFGTNDLTSFTWALSRDNGNELVRRYLDIGVLESSPFMRFDEDGVGRLMRYAMRLARQANPRIVAGVCGESSSSASGLASLLDLEVDYVSCQLDAIPVVGTAIALHAGHPLGVYRERA